VVSAVVHVSDIDRARMAYVTLLNWLRIRKHIQSALITD